MTATKKATKKQPLAADLPKGNRPVARRTPAEVKRLEAERIERMNKMPKPKGTHLAADVVTKPLTAPKGMTKAQQAEFDRALKRREANAAKAIPAEFQAACELIPQIGLPFGSAQERTNVASLIKRATAFAKEAGIAPESIDLIAQFTNYINHTNTESRKPNMNTTSTRKGNTTTTRAASNGTASTSITEAEIDTFVAKWEKSGGKMTKGAIVEAIRESGAKIGYPGGDYLVALLAKRGTSPAQKAAVKPAAKAATKAAPKASKAAGKPSRAVGNLTRKTVTPIPKKATKKSATAAARKPVRKVTKRVR